MRNVGAVAVSPLIENSFRGSLVSAILVQESNPYKVLLAREKDIHRNRFYVLPSVVPKDEETDLGSLRKKTLSLCNHWYKPAIHFDTPIHGEDEMSAFGLIKQKHHTGDKGRVFDARVYIGLVEAIDSATIDPVAEPLKLIDGKISYIKTSYYGFINERVAQWVDLREAIWRRRGRIGDITMTALRDYKELMDYYLGLDPEVKGLRDDNCFRMEIAPSNTERHLAPGQPYPH